MQLAPPRVSVLAVLYHGPHTSKVSSVAGPRVAWMDPEALFDHHLFPACPLEILPYDHAFLQTLGFPRHDWCIVSCCNNVQAAASSSTSDHQCVRARHFGALFGVPVCALFLFVFNMNDDDAAVSRCRCTLQRDSSLLRAMPFVLSEVSCGLLIVVLETDSIFWSIVAYVG
jgi:hypothetical protein